MAVLGSSSVDQLPGGGRSSDAIGKDPDQGRAGCPWVALKTGSAA